MLESLTKSVDQIVRASDVILEAVSAGAVPDAVLTRLKGERVSGEPVDLVRKRAEKELIDLGEVLASKFDEDKQFGDFVDFRVGFQSGEKNVTFSFTGDKLEFSYGNITLAKWLDIAPQLGAGGLKDIKEVMLFLSNLDHIKERISTFLDKLKAMRV